MEVFKYTKCVPVGVSTLRSCSSPMKASIPPSRAKVREDKGSVRSRKQTTKDMGDGSSMMCYHALVLVDVSFRCLLCLLFLSLY